MCNVHVCYSFFLIPKEFLDMTVTEKILISIWNSCIKYSFSAIKVDIFLTFSGSLLALGALFGSLSAVYLMDAVGRKASLLAFSVMSLFIGWTLLMAASQVWQLYTGRFLLGLGAGMEITICPVYIHEICRPALRDVCGSFPQVSRAAKNTSNFHEKLLMMSFCYMPLGFYSTGYSDMLHHGS